MAAERAPAFQWYPKDFLADGAVMRMSMTERGVYITLLSVCWLERDLPSDMKDLSRIVGMPAKRFQKMWTGALSACFQPGDEGRLTHKRLERERMKQEEHRQRSSDKGKGGAAARWGNVMSRASSRQASSNAKPMPSNGSPISDLPSPEKKQPTAVDRPEEQADPNVRIFLKWFQEEYKAKRHGAAYLVKWQKDGPLVKAMLKAVDVERLQKLARILLSDKTDEPFIVDSDRGVGILSTKFNWLNDRLAAWEARRAS